jgi:hypothetical protein
VLVPAELELLERPLDLLDLLGDGHRVEVGGAEAIAVTTAISLSDR